MNELHVLALTVVWTWAGLVLASTFRNRGWNPAGLKLMVGNRDEVPPPAQFAARLDRLTRNMVENLVLFAPALLGAKAAGVSSALLTQAAWLFLGLRVIYLCVGALGVPWVRSGVWIASLFPIGQLLWWTLQT